MTSKPANVLITGGAGFIGSHLVDRIIDENFRVTVIDNFNEFYAPAAKRSNIVEHLERANYELIEGDIRNAADLQKVAQRGPFDIIVHLAAMAGVRPSLEKPALYMDVNIMGTQRLIDLAAQQQVPPFFVHCSSSSVYGGRAQDMFLETDVTDRPMSPYAASKIASEAAMFAAHHTLGLRAVCLRPFTVYGPRQRPDLAIHKFCHLMEQGRPIELFGDGSTRRDYTFVADIVDGVYRAMHYQDSDFEIINLGRSQPVSLMEMVESLERALGKKAEIIHQPEQTGDVPNTFACIDKARKLLGYEPRTSLDQGVSEFVKWMRRNAQAPVRA